jgi:hypothetical protein
VEAPKKPAALPAKARIIISIVSGMVAIAVAWIQVHNSSQSSPPPPQAPPAVISGTVVDQETNEAVRQAEITISGVPGVNSSDDAGNFRFTVENNSSHRDFRLRVSKNGYSPKDISITPPVENLIVQLHRNPA